MTKPQGAMPRIPRMVRADSGLRTVYHVISRTALDGLPFKKAENDDLVRAIQRFFSLSHYAKDINQTFSRYYNRHKKRRGTQWGERFGRL